MMGGGRRTDAAQPTPHMTACSDHQSAIIKNVPRTNMQELKQLKVLASDFFFFLFLVESSG